MKEYLKHFMFGLQAASWLRQKAVGFYLRRKYGSHIITDLKERNFIQAQIDYFHRAVEVASLPYILNLDTLNLCNLTCPFCPTGTGQNYREKNRIPLEHAKQVIDAVRSHVLEIRLFNWGEPFLNPDIYETIRYAGEAGLYTVINSNLSLSRQRLAEDIVDSGLDLLVVSMDGLEQETLCRYRRHASIAQVLKNIREIVEIKRRRHAGKPRVEVAFLVFRHNEHEIPRLKAMEKDLGVDFFYARRAFIYHPAFVPKNPNFQPLLGFGAGTCRFLYHELTIEADGAITPCCTTTSSIWDTGRWEDVNNLKIFYNSERYRRMRAVFSPKGQHLAGAGENDVLCRYCEGIRDPDGRMGELSPLPPHFIYAGETFKHGLS
jgi:pyruvate-formate lyase-activating enzyme